MRRPRPASRSDPRPTDCASEGPSSVGVRHPGDRHAGIPDVAVAWFVQPGTVAVEGAAVIAQIGGKVLRRDRSCAGSLVVLLLDPDVEGVTRGGNRRVGAHRGRVHCAGRFVAGAQSRAAGRRLEFRGAAENAKPHLWRRAAPGVNRHAIFAGGQQPGDSARGIHAVVGVALASRDQQSHAARGHAQQVVRQERDIGGLVEVEHAAVRKEHFDAAATRADAVAGE